jgi:hypothetical protein
MNAYRDVSLSKWRDLLLIVSLSVSFIFSEFLKIPSNGQKVPGIMREIAESRIF